MFLVTCSRVAPYTHLLPYPDCDVSTPIRRSTDAATELLRHGLNQGVMAFMIDQNQQCEKFLLDG